MSSGFYLVTGVMHLNMASEIMFVLANRMKAQKVDMNTVGSRILCDVTLMMFKPSFIDNLLKPQTPLTIPTLYEIFNKMVNCSLMKLDRNSMEKLFYLVLMTFKRQLFLLSSPLELYTLTVSHLEDVAALQRNNGQAVECLKEVLEIFKSQSENWSFINYLDLKQEMLSMLQSYKSKIVLFCETGSQEENGCLIYNPRNAHNRKNIGLAQNHPCIDFPDAEAWTGTRNLQYANYRSWKTNLGKDDYDNVKGSSKVLESKSKIKSVKPFEDENDDGKQLKDILGIKNMKLDTYEVHIDIFSSTSPAPSSVNQSSKAQSQPQPLVQSHSNTNQIKNKIDKQFDNLILNQKKGGDDQIDLLELMDS